MNRKSKRLKAYPQTMSELIDRCLEFDERFRINSVSTRKSRRTRLTGRICKVGTVAEMFEMVGIRSPQDLDRDSALKIYDFFSKVIPNKSYRMWIIESVRHVVKYSMNEGFIESDNHLLGILHMEMDDIKPLKVPTKNELDTMEKHPLAESPFLATQMFFVIGILIIRLGLRSGKEIVSLNVSDFDLKNRLLYVNRKRGRIRPVSFGKELVPIVRYYLWIRYLYLKRHNATSEEALIIKSNCNIRGRGGKKSWRLTAAGLIARWRVYRRKMGIPDERRLYDFRRLSVSIQCKIGRILGLAVSDLAFRNDHNREIFNRHYNVFIHDKAEQLTMDIDENIDYVKSCLKDALETFQKNPTKIEYLAGAKRLFDTLGDFQNEKDSDIRHGGVASNCDMGFHKTIKSISRISRKSEYISNSKKVSLQTNIDPINPLTSLLLQGLPISSI